MGRTGRISYAKPMCRFKDGCYKGPRPSTDEPRKGAGIIGMYFTIGRRHTTAGMLKTCTLCGAQLPLPAGAAQPAESLCATCARPVKLGGARADVARAGAPVGRSV